MARRKSNAARKESASLSSESVETKLCFKIKIKIKRSCQSVEGQCHCKVNATDDTQSTFKTFVNRFNLERLRGMCRRAFDNMSCFVIRQVGERNKKSVAVRCVCIHEMAM